jgi:hypothetical protein
VRLATDGDRPPHERVDAPIHSVSSASQGVRRRDSGERRRRCFLINPAYDLMPSGALNRMTPETAWVVRGPRHVTIVLDQCSEAVMCSVGVIDVGGVFRGFAHH